MSRLAPVTAAALIAASAHAAGVDADTASFAIDTQVKVASDQRTRGISDSLNRPGVKLTAQVAHESGLLGLVEISTVSSKQYLEGDGLNVTLASGYRFGDPERWHFGVGAAAELFPGAKFDAPHALDVASGEPSDVRTTRYDSAYGVLEVGYGALEGRILNVLSKDYRGADTGGVCGTMLALMPDPTRALQCYARGDHDSRGSWLFDLDYTIDVAPATTLKLHSGVQRIKHFQEGDFSDYAVGLAHKHWGLEWSATWVATRTRVRELFLVQDGSSLRATDGSRLVVAVAREF